MQSIHNFLTYKNSETENYHTADQHTQLSS